MRYHVESEAMCTNENLNRKSGGGNPPLPTQNFLQHFGTCHVMVWTHHILSISQVYTWCIPSLNCHVTGTKMMQKVLSSFMSGIYFTLSYDIFMHGIYQVFTWYILFPISIYQEYTWYMTFLLAYTRYILGIIQVYTWWLVLWRRTWPHAARATGNHITVFTTLAHFTFAHVNANDGKPRFLHEQHTKRSIWVSTDNPYSTKAGILRRG